MGKNFDYLLPSIVNHQHKRGWDQTLVQIRARYTRLASYCKSPLVC